MRCPECRAPLPCEANCCLKCGRRLHPSQRHNAPRPTVDACPDPAHAVISPFDRGKPLVSQSDSVTGIERSLFIVGFYSFFPELILTHAPHLLLHLNEIPSAPEFRIRVLGIIAGIAGLYGIHTSRCGFIPFLRTSVYGSHVGIQSRFGSRSGAWQKHACALRASPPRKRCPGSRRTPRGLGDLGSCLRGTDVHPSSLTFQVRPYVWPDMPGGRILQTRSAGLLGPERCRHSTTLQIRV